MKKFWFFWQAWSLWFWNRLTDLLHPVN